MKILYHHRTRSKDGQHVHIVEIIEAFRNNGHEVIVVAPSSDASESIGYDGGSVKLLKRYLPKFCYELAELAYSLVAYRRLAQAVEEHRPDFLYERYNLMLPAGAWIKRKYKLPMMLEVNAPIFEERSRYDGISLRRLARWSQSYTWKSADCVLPVTRVLGDIVQSYGVEHDRVSVIHNGINPRHFDCAPSIHDAKATLGLQGNLVLGFTGFVREWHGLDKVIDLMADAATGSEFYLLVVGDGPARAALEQQAKRLGVSHRVRFTGVISRDEVARYVAAFDVALQPAVVAYASPLKLFEYLALGKAIVGPSQPNIKEILADEFNAILFDPDNPNSLTEAISRLSSNTELRKTIGLNAKKTIEEMRLTWDENAVRICDLFQRLTIHAGPSAGKDEFPPAPVSAQS